MRKHLFYKLLLVILTICFFYVPDVKSQDPPPPARAARRTFRLQVEVVSGADRVEGATVTLKSEEGGVDFSKKLPNTGRDGTTSASSVPEGRLLLQVIAMGHATFGAFITLAQDNQVVQASLTKNAPTPPPN